MTEAMITEGKSTTHKGLVGIHRDGLRVVDIDPATFKQPTLRDTVAESFRDAAAIKHEALSHTTTIAEAIEQARSSYDNPLDIAAAIATHEPPRPTPEQSDNGAEMSEDMFADIEPYTALRDKLAHIVQGSRTTEKPEVSQTEDRLQTAVETLRSAVKNQRDALKTLGKGGDKVYSSAILALARRTSVHGGSAVAHYQQRFSERSTRTWDGIDTATKTLVGDMVETKKRETTLNAVKDRRNALTPQYLPLIRYLEEQASHETALIADRDRAAAIISELEALSSEIANKISELRNTAPEDIIDPAESADATNEDSAIEALLQQADEVNAVPETESDTDKAVIRKTRVIAEAEKSLDECDGKLSLQRSVLRRIEADLNHLRKHIPPYIKNERELRDDILENLVVPTLLATSSETQAALQAFGQMRTTEKAKYDALPQLVREYAEAELWFNNEFAPRAVRQLKQSDPKRYADLDVAESEDKTPLSTADIRRFMKSVGIIVLNRKDALSARIFNAAQEYGLAIPQSAYNTAVENSADARQMMLHSAGIAGENAELREQFIVQGNEVGEEITAGLRNLDEYMRDVEEAMAEMQDTLRAIGDSTRLEYQSVDRIAELMSKYRAVQQETISILAQADQAVAEQLQLKSALRENILHLAGLTSNATDEEPSVTPTEKFRDALRSGADELSADVMAEGYAVRAQDLNNQLWAEYALYEKQSAKRAELIRQLNVTRLNLFNIMEQGAANGHAVLTAAYAVIEHTIEQHDSLPVALGPSEAEVHRRFINTTGQLAIGASEKSAKPTPTRQLTQWGRATIGRAGILIGEAITRKK